MADDLSPREIVSQRAKKYGYCQECNQYGVIILEASLCRDCFFEYHQSDWEANQDKKIAALREKRLEKAWENEVKKRHLKGMSPINLRR